MNQVAPSARRWIGHPWKRALDLVCAGTLLLFSSPLLLAIAVAVKATSRGPVFYRQRRLGYDEVPFWVLKFRTMRADADQVGPAFTATGDPRVTPIGRLLRAASLDELPQLINVLRGEMSLLGPRPYVGFELGEWTVEERRLRASIRPGVSGLAQATGRSSLSAETIRQRDLEYVRRCGLLFDCWLIGQTVRAVVLRRGVN